MDAVWNFLKEIFTKIEVMLPTLIAAVSSCGGIFIYKLSTILANVKSLKDALKNSRDENETLRTQLILALDTLDEMYEVVNLLVENTPNIKVKKAGREMIKKLKCKSDIITIPVVNNVAAEAVKIKRKVKIKKAKKVTQQ